MSRSQRILTTFHLWLGLVLGAVFVLIGLTGSLITFQDELDRFLNPQLLGSSPAAEEAVTVADAVDAVRSRTGSEELVSYVSLPRGDHDVYRAYAGTPENIFSRMVTVDPGSGRVLGERPVGDSLMRFIHILHFRLHLGSSGQTLVGLAGLFLLCSLLSGILLWWRGGRIWRPFSPGRAWRLHYTIGVYAGVPLLLVLVTGIILALPQYSRPAVAWFSPLSGLDLGLQSGEPEGREDMGVDAAVQRALAAMPDGEVSSIGLPRRPEGSYRVSVREAEPDGMRARTGHVVLDRYNGEELARRDWDDHSNGDRFMAWQRPLHDGSAFGLPGRLAVAAIGLAPLCLFMTGLWLWFKGKAVGSRRRG